MKRINPTRSTAWIRARKNACVRVAMLAIVSGAALGFAQPDTNMLAPTTPKVEAPARTDADLQRMLADAVERIALLDLRMRRSPAPSDYRIVDAMLGVAFDLDPTDTEVARHRLEAAYQCADLQAVEARTREIVRLDPADTVSVVRLISLQMGRLQTVRDRIRAYDRFLGPDGDRLDPSVRSRLALDAALLVREQGDEDGFVRRLSQAVALDATHKEAAALAATYFASRRPDDRLGGIELTSNLLLADPVDPNVHFAMASELAKVGAFDAANRFHRNGRQLLSSNAARANDEGLQIERLILSWQLEGPEVAHKEILDQLALARYNQSVQLDQMVRAGVPTTDAVAPEDIRLGLSTERVRLLAADAMGDRTAVAESIADYARSVERQVSTLQDRTRRPAWMTEQDVTQQLITIVVERFIVHAWTGVGIEDMINQMREMQMLENLQLPVLRAWLALYRETPLIAEARFEALLGEHPLARLGMGLAREKAGDALGAVAHYRRVAEDFPLSVAAAWTRSRSLQLTGEDISVSDLTSRANALAAQAPQWLDRIVTDPTSFMGLTVKADRATYGPLDPVRLSITLRNRSPIALGVGADRPLNSRMLISPELDLGWIGGNSSRQQLTPEVLDMHRRFRLPARSEFTVTVWAEPGFSGWLAETAAGAAMRGRYRVFQGFEIRGGILAQGPMCLSAQSDQVLRTPLPGTDLPPSELATRIQSADTSTLPEAIALLRMRLVRPLATDTPTDLAYAVSTLAERYATASPHERALMLAMMPHVRLAPAAAAFDRAIENSLARETDRTVLALAIVTRAALPGSPILTAPGVQADAGLARLAALQRERLERDEGLCYSRATAPSDLMTAPEQAGAGNAQPR